MRGEQEVDFPLLMLWKPQTNYSSSLVISPCHGEGLCNKCCTVSVPDQSSIAVLSGFAGIPGIEVYSDEITGDHAGPEAQFPER
jgi:hypothetical protein